MIFEKASFEPNDFRSAVVDGKTLYIYLHSMKEPLHMDFKSGTDAQAALIRLDAEVAEKRTTKVGDSAPHGNTVETKPSIFACFDKLVQKGKEKVQNVVDGTSVEALIFQMAADQAASTVKAKAEELSQKLEDVLGTVTAAVAVKKEELDDELKAVILDMQRGFAAMATEVPDDADKYGVEDEKPQEDEGTKAKGAGWTRQTTKKSIFNGDTFSGAVQAELQEEEIRPGSVGSEDEPLIGDMTSPELKALIEEFVDGAMTNPKTQQVFGNIYEIFGKEEAGLAVENLKKIIYEMAVNNPHVKLSDVLKRFLG